MVAGHHAAEIYAVGLRHGVMNADLTAKPRMIPIENFLELGSVGVPKPCCTTARGLTRAWDGRCPIRPTSTRCRQSRLRHNQGHVKLNQMINLTTTGAASGALWGTLIGFIFLNPLIGTALGAASGALGGKFSDIGINDQFMKDTASALQPNTAGLFLLIRKMTTDKVLADLKGVGGTLIQTSFDETKEAALRAALSAVAETGAPEA